MHVYLATEVTNKDCYPLLTNICTDSINGTQNTYDKICSNSSVVRTLANAVGPQFNSQSKVFFKSFKNHTITTFFAE